jgi:hypothetical protein
MPSVLNFPLYPAGRSLIVILRSGRAVRLIKSKGTAARVCLVPTGETLGQIWLGEQHIRGVQP